MPWLDKPWNNLNAWLQDRFGEKVYRVSIDGGFTCPNRDGTLARGGCIYCNEAGARADYVQPELEVKEQLSQGIQIMRRHYHAQKFLAYFQAYSGTYAPVEKLLKLYSAALEHPQVVGLCVGTRPDCIHPAILDLLEDIARTKLVIVEYGIQTVHPRSLELINRHHSVDDSQHAIAETVKRKNIITLAHLILGLPGETRQDMMESVRTVLDWGVQALKLHHLYVEKDTPLALMYHRKEFEIMPREEYLDLLCAILAETPPRIVIHRLFGQCSREKLVAPDWTLNKTLNMELLIKKMNEMGIEQGCRSQVSNL